MEVKTGISKTEVALLMLLHPELGTVLSYERFFPDYPSGLHAQ